VWCQGLGSQFIHEDVDVHKEGVWGRLRNVPQPLFHKVNYSCLVGEDFLKTRLLYREAIHH
jgi:hypothetical protein